MGPSPDWQSFNDDDEQVLKAVAHSVTMGQFVELCYAASEACTNESICGGLLCSFSKHVPMSQFVELCYAASEAYPSWWWRDS